MSSKVLLVFVLVLALVSIACGFTVDIPIDKIQTGPTQTELINVPAPEVTPANLELAFGAGELDLTPGTGPALVEGTARYNVPDLKPKITAEGSDVSITTGNIEIKGFPSLHFKDLKNVWDLSLSDAPMNLSINAGAYKGEMELGGLNLLSLDIADGAADVSLTFSTPNKSEMSMLRYVTGASSVKLENLANANFRSMIFRGGAGDYSLDFSGAFQQDALVTVESGISQITIYVPEGTSAVVNFKAGLSNVSTSGNWEKSGNTYSLAGSGPMLTINIDMAAGDLQLRTR